MSTTPTGIPVELCQQCGRNHPATREHCPECGIASLFPHDAHQVVPHDPRDYDTDLFGNAS